MGSFTSYGLSKFLHRLSKQSPEGTKKYQTNTAVEVQSEIGITRSDISKIGKVVLRSLMNASESAQPY